jgi:hypothetical protein
VSIRFYLKLSKGWGWSGRNYHPHLTHFLTTENSKWHGPAASHLTLYIEPVGGKLRLAAQDIQNKDTPHGLTQGPLRGGYNGKFYDSEDVLFDDDKWHCVEAYFKLNTLDLENDRPNRDGIVRGWFDGKLVVEHTDVVLRSTDFPKMKFNQFLMAPYFGPGLLPHAQKLWIDELTVGTKRIGPLEASDQSLNLLVVAGERHPLPSHDYVLELPYSVQQEPTIYLVCRSMIRPTSSSATFFPSLGHLGIDEPSLKMRSLSPSAIGNKLRKSTRSFQTWDFWSYLQTASTLVPGDVPRIMVVILAWLLVTFTWLAGNWSRVAGILGI